MALLSVGRLCIKDRGREAGSKCVVVNVVDKNFVEVTGPKEVTGVRRRRVNASHLIPLERSIKIRKGATDAMVLTALKRSKLVPFMRGERVERVEGGEGVAKSEEADSP